jgi:hypothetical protein
MGLEVDRVTVDSFPLLIVILLFPHIRQHFLRCKIALEQAAQYHILDLEAGDFIPEQGLGGY